MKSLLLFVAVFTLAYGQVVLRLNEQDVSIVVNEGNNVTFRCEIAGTITVSIRPPEGGPFVTNLPASVMTDGRDDLVTITVVDAQRDNNTVAFHCGVGGLVTNIGILTVYYAPNYMNPGPQTFREGDMNAQVTVSLDANPSPDFMWTKGVSPISGNNIVQTVNTITFNPARREDTGTYTIFGNNSAGSDSTTFDITVNYIPLFDSGIGNVQCSGSEPTYTCAVMTGSGGVLNCSAIGSPTPTVTPDPSTASTVVFMNDQFSITGADTGTAGTYSCNASNSVGSAVRTFQVWVGGAPTLVRFDSLNVSDSDVMITWTFNDMGVPVSSFNLTINCDGQPPFSYDVSVPPMGNQVTSTRPLANYPADTSCTVTVGASNLLGSSNDLTNVFMTPATETTATPLTTPSNGGAAFSAAIFSVLLLMIASLVF